MLTCRDPKACFEAFARGLASGVAGDRNAPLVQMDHESADWYSKGRNQGHLLRRVHLKAAAFELHIDPPSLQDQDLV